jgi:hypothetical protein
MVSTIRVFSILRIVRHNLLRMLEPADRDAVPHHVHRNARLDVPVLISGIWYYASLGSAAESWLGMTVCKCAAS